MIEFHPMTDRDFEKPIKININGEQIEACQTVLIKTKYNYYYVCCPCIKEPDNILYFTDRWVFEEAAGERFTCWEEAEILGWMPITELDKIPIRKAENFRANHKESIEYISWDKMKQYMYDNIASSNKEELDKIFADMYKCAETGCNRILLDYKISFYAKCFLNNLGYGVTYDKGTDKVTICWE